MVLRAAEKLCRDLTRLARSAATDPGMGEVH
jgi:hypothetical protein